MVRTLVLSFLLATASIVALVGLSVIDDVRPVLTGAAVAGEHVGYVAVTDQPALRRTIEAVRRYPVRLESGRFRGHYFLKIRGQPNNVRSATYWAAIRAERADALLFYGIQLESSTLINAKAKEVL